MYEKNIENNMDMRINYKSHKSLSFFNQMSTDINLSRFRLEPSSDPQISHVIIDKLRELINKELESISNKKTSSDIPLLNSGTIRFDTVLEEIKSLGD